MSSVYENSGFTGSFSKAGLIEGTNANTLKTAAPNGAGVDFAINGVAYHLADGDNIAMTALAVQAVSTTCMYLVSLNSSGTLSIIKGDEVLTSILGVGDSAQIPGPATDLCPIGAFKIVTDASTTFTSGTTDLGASGITDTMYDYMGGIANEPQVS